MAPEIEILDTDIEACPALANHAVARCIAAYEETCRAQLAKNESECKAKDKAIEAYRSTLPRKPIQFANHSSIRLAELAAYTDPSCNQAVNLTPRNQPFFGHFCRFSCRFLGALGRFRRPSAPHFKLKDEG